MSDSETMFHTVYDSYESTPGGRDYLGKHSTDNPYDEYLGSYVDETFNPDSKIVLGYSKTEEGALWLEMMWQKVFNVVEDPQYANRSFQTSSGFTNTHPETKKKLSEAKTGNKNPMFGKVRPEHSDRMKGENNPFFGKTHTPETREQWSKNYSGENARFFGRVHTDEAKRKISDSKKGVSTGTWTEERKNKLASSVRGMLHWVNSEEKTKRSKECPGPEWKRGRKWREDE